MANSPRSQLQMRGGNMSQLLGVLQETPTDSIRNPKITYHETFSVLESDSCRASAPNSFTQMFHFGS